jgi:acetyl esterase/lipase
MRPHLRTRLFSWLLPRLPGGTVAGASRDAIARMQQRTIRDTPVSRMVMSRPVRGVEVVDLEVQGAQGVLSARCYRPYDAGRDLPIVVHLHGQGWVLRDLEIGDWLLSRVALGVPAAVVSVDYRVAPQHPFPAAVEDALAATTWVADHGHQFGGDPTRLAIMGDSSGANLAAVTALGARDAGGPRLSCQVLLYPPTDLTGGSPSLSEDPKAPILPRELQRTIRELYLGDADPTDPRASPLLASDHHGLPPTLIQVGDRDPLRDDARRYAAALRAAEVPVRATIYLGAVHGFLSFPGVSPPARQAAWEIINELRLHLNPCGAGDLEVAR